MRNKAVTEEYYINQLGFQLVGEIDFEGYLMIEKDAIQIHFFEFKALEPKENYGQVYIRTNNIDTLYQSFLDNKIAIPMDHWKQNPGNKRNFLCLTLTTTY